MGKGTMILPIFEFELFLVIEQVMIKKLSECVPEKKSPSRSKQFCPG